MVSSLEYSLHPVGPTIMAGVMAWPISQAREVLRFYREFTESVPDELACLAGVGHAPDGSGVKVAIIAAAYCGPMTEGERMLRPIKEFGSPLFDTIQPTEYSTLNGMFDAAYPKGMLYYWKSNFLSTLDDTLLTRLWMRLSIVLRNIAASRWSTGMARSLASRKIRQPLPTVAKATICCSFLSGRTVQPTPRILLGHVRALLRWSPSSPAPGTSTTWIKMTRLT